MELKNKKIVFLGDSITEGTGVEDPANIYWKILARMTGAQCFGYGIGGTRIAPQREPSWNPLFDRYFASRIEEMETDADIVVVFGGTNDFGHGDASFGTMDDRTEETFCGAVHCLLQKLIARYPLAQIVVMTPLHRLVEHYVYNELGVRAIADLEEYVNAIIQISAYYGIPVLDLYRVSGLQPTVPALHAQYMADGVHPKDAGHERIAQKLKGFLTTL